MKKHYVILLVILMMGPAIYAQVGINTDSGSPDASAMLDVKSSDKGLLIPRMSSFQKNSIPVPAEGLMVYDTDLGAICYFHEGLWITLLAKNSGWSLSGNEGIDPYDQFIGTTDSARLIFKVYNTLAGSIVWNGSTTYGILAGSHNRADANTFVGSFSGYSNSTGNWNTAVGSNSLEYNTTGSANNAFGKYAAYNTFDGSDNVAIGNSALYANESGSYNVAVGNSASHNGLSGNGNTAVGHSSLLYNGTGHNNTAIGYQAGFLQTDLDNAISIGYYAMAQSSNEVRLGNTNIVSLYCKGAYVPTTSDPPNMVVLSDGQILRSSSGMLTGSGSTNRVAFWTGVSGLGSSPELYWNNSSESLGIGTSSPNDKLTLQDGDIALTSTTTGSYGIKFYESDAFGNNYTSIKAQAQAADINYILPASDGLNGYLMTTNGSGVMSWTAPSQADITGVGSMTTGNVFSSLAADDQWLGLGENAGRIAFDHQSIDKISIMDAFVGIGTDDFWRQLTISGSFELPYSTDSQTGVIYKGDSRFIHDYKPPNCNGMNTFLGINAGNFSMTASSGGEASSNTAIGNSSLSSLTSGYQNTGVGAQSLQNNQSGYSNTAVGNTALYVNVSGINNTAVGAGSLSHNTSGQNTSVGTYSSYSNNSGSYNTNLGWSAGSKNSTGIFNTMCGAESGGVWYEAANPYSRNSAFGYQSAYSLTTGSNNTLLGFSAGYGITSGSYNIVLGFNADVPNPTGNYQMVIGAADVLYGNLSNKRIGIGTSSPGQKLTVEGTFGLIEGGTSPVYHTIFQGADQSSDITYTLPADDGSTGQFLTTDGSGALDWTSISAGDINSVGSMTSGDVFNSASADNQWLGLGAAAGRIEFDDQTTDEVNILNAKVGIGTSIPAQQLEITQSFRMPSTSSSSTGVIYKGVYSFIHDYAAPSSFGKNTFVGVLSGNFSMGISASNNTGVGYYALSALSSGAYNVAFGVEALRFNNVGSNNIGIGYDALGSQNSGDDNVGIGYYAGYFNDAGERNVLLGTFAGEGYPGSSFSNTTAIGYYSGSSITSGNGNTTIGYSAGDAIGTGSNNTIIGNTANASSSSISNGLAIGYNALVNANNKAVIGNASVITIGGYGAWINYSDRRLKENISYRNDIGLDFIMKLRPASYNYIADENKSRRDGLIAQDVQQSLQELGVEFSGLVKDDDPDGTLNLSYGEFVIPLINAVKEQQEMIKALQEEVKELKAGGGR